MMVKVNPGVRQISSKVFLSKHMSLELTNTVVFLLQDSGADPGGGCRGCAPPPPEMTYGFLIQLVFCKKKNYVVYPGAEVEQQTSAPPPKKNPGSAPEI